LDQTNPEPDNQDQTATPHWNPKMGEPKGSKVHQLLHEQQLYTPKNRERKSSTLLTVDQYLGKAKQDKAVFDLIRSLHRTKIMSFAEWERTVATLLKKKTW
jgi:hypothetical protein